MNTLPPFSFENQFNSIMYNQVQLSPVDSTWTEHDHSLFLRAVVNLPDDIAGRWQEMANAIPGKTADEVKAYYEEVEHTLLEIEAGRVELPNYPDDESESGGELMTKREEKGKKKATPWSMEEHRNFLHGLQIYGKGDWRSISRMMVITRTPTQVASHAQKFFLRQASLKEDNNNNNEENNNNKKKRRRRRCSIHDFNAVDMPSTSQSSLKIGPDGPGMDVQAQPISSTPPVTTTFCGGAPQPYMTSFYDGHGVGTSSHPTLPPDDFYSEHGPGPMYLVRD